MKFINSAFIILMMLSGFSSCDAVRQATNSTGTGFSLNGQWQLKTNTPENTLIGTVVSVTAFVAEGKIVSLKNNTQCYRDHDIKWKDIKPQTNGSFTLNNLLSNCQSGDLKYESAILEVVSNDEIKISGKNISEQANSQIWVRIK